MEARAVYSLDHKNDVDPEKLKRSRVQEHNGYLEKEVSNEPEVEEEHDDEFEEDEVEDNRMVIADAVKQYLKEIGTFPLLTAEREYRSYACRTKI